MDLQDNQPQPVQDAILHVLQKAAKSGHVFLPQDMLFQKIREQNSFAPSLVKAAISDLESSQQLVCEQFTAQNSAPQTGIYLNNFHRYESETAHLLRNILNSPRAINFTDANNTVSSVIAKIPLQLTSDQIAAIKTATKAKILIVTGGPGTGKTTIINAIIKVFETEKAKILLAAPTGRAAKRMAEASDHDAKTIHRLLEYNPEENTFGKNDGDKLDCDLLIVDEASMLDNQLFHHLLKATPPEAAIILVGDNSQLPSIGAGNVLSDIIDSGAITVASLNEIFRQSAESKIIQSAHLINCGKMPNLKYSRTKQEDFYFVPCDEPERCADLMVEFIQHHIPKEFGFDPVDDIQLITPMRKGPIGTENMNKKLQLALNPNGIEIKIGERYFCVHDKVTQTRNNYDKNIFNGDTGRIVYFNLANRELWVDFNGMIIPYNFNELDELVQSYAITIHKSQGLEYPAVIMPVMTQHYSLLQRNLIYTGITRGKKLVVLFGESHALKIAIKNNKTNRFTRLAEKIANSNTA